MKRNATIFISAILFANSSSWAVPNFKSIKAPSPQTVLKADEISGDQVTNTLIAKGHVEVNKANTTLYADEASYDKNGAMIRAIGHVKIRNIEVGNVEAREVQIKDDFSSGKFLDSNIIFNDGSYLVSPEIDRKTPLITVLQYPTYSICPNPDIEADNSLVGKKRDLISIKSTSTTIDRDKGMIKSKHGIFRIYNVPILYTPYLQTALKSKKRQTGFLSPSYAKSTNLGLGIRTPFYTNIAPNMDLTTTPYIGISNNQIILNNEFRHLTSYGEYRTNIELANNKLDSTTIETKKSNKEYRGYLSGNGIFDFTKNAGLDFKINTVNDPNYLRDYYNDFLNHTLSKVNLDYIKGREYHSIKTIRIQELELFQDQASAPLILPSIDSHIETKPQLFNEKFILTSNTTVITRDSGLQYRRVTMTPEATIPFNIKGNIFNFDAKVQGDAYSLENNFQQGTQANNNYEGIQTNYKPEMSLNWRLPLIKKNKLSTIVIEPMAMFVASSYKKSFSKLPNEDSNNSELTISNLFVTDRIAGFDRNESGERMNYGVKSSLFNKYGEFALTLGQSFRKKGQRNNQDVAIRGFSTSDQSSIDKSNIVGQTMYKLSKYFSIIYAFQLDQSSYRNDVNEITTILTLDRFSLSSNYLLLRRNSQNLQTAEQITLSTSAKVTSKVRVDLSATKNLVTGRMLSRSLAIYRDGCCTVFGFSVIELTPSDIIKPQKTFNLILSFKNL